MQNVNEIEQKLVEAGKVLQTIKGQEVEGLVRPTTDRRKLEALLAVVEQIITAVRQILAGMGQSAHVGQSNEPCGESGSDS